MKTRMRNHPRTVPPRHLWSGRIWPVLAGAVTAVGVVAAGNALGLLACVLVYVTVSTVAVAMLWGVALDIGIRRSSAVRWGFDAALVALVAVGLCSLHPLYGPLVGVAVGATAPAAKQLVSKYRSRATRPGGRTARASGLLVDQGLLERRFDDIVSRLTEPDELPED